MSPGCRGSSSERRFTGDVQWHLGSKEGGVGKGIFSHGFNGKTIGKSWANSG